MAQSVPVVSRHTHTVPDIWKRSIIVLVPKKTCPLENNDFRPVALTSNVVKSLERILVEDLGKDTEPSLDPHQFAYERNRGTGDAISFFKSQNTEASGGQ